MDETPAEGQPDTQTVTIQGLAVPDGVPDILTDGFFSVNVANGVARLVLFALRPGLGVSESLPIAVCRLAIPISVLPQFHQSLGQLITTLERDGHLQKERI